MFPLDAYNQTVIFSSEEFIVAEVKIYGQTFGNILGKVTSTLLGGQNFFLFDQIFLYVGYQENFKFNLSKN